MRLNIRLWRTIHLSTIAPFILNGTFELACFEQVDPHNKLLLSSLASSFRCDHLSIIEAKVGITTGKRSSIVLPHKV